MRERGCVHVSVAEKERESESERAISPPHTDFTQQSIHITVNPKCHSQSPAVQRNGISASFAFSARLLSFKADLIFFIERP